MIRNFEDRHYRPRTPFGEAVAKSGFGRVCPRCWHKWSDQKTYAADNVGVGVHRFTVDVKKSERDADGIERTRLVPVRIKQTIWSHRNCGGQTVTDADSGFRAQL